MPQELWQVGSNCPCQRIMGLDSDWKSGGSSPKGTYGLLLLAVRRQPWVSRACLVRIWHCPNNQKLAVGSDVPAYPIDVVQHSGVIRASGVKGAISINPDAATITFDLNQATTHGVTLSDDRTLALANATVGDRFCIRLQQDITGSIRTVTWFSHIKWAGGGTAPTLTTTAHKADLLDFLAASGDGANIWYDGFVVGQNI